MNPISKVYVCVFKTKVKNKDHWELVQKCGNFALCVLTINSFSSLASNEFKSLYVFHSSPFPSSKDSCGFRPPAPHPSLSPYIAGICCIICKNILPNLPTNSESKVRSALPDAPRVSLRSVPSIFIFHLLETHKFF